MSVELQVNFAVVCYSLPTITWSQGRHVGVSALLDHDPWGFGSCIMASIFMGNATIIILSGTGTL